MDTEKMKNMIVLKNLPSNILDEAIVILKPNIKLKSVDLSENKKDIKKTKKESIQNPKKYIINEAEMIIGNYISKIEDNQKGNLKSSKKIETRCRWLKAISIFLGMMLLASFLIK